MTWAIHPLRHDLFLARLLDASVDGIAAFDRDCQFIAWNRAMEQFSGKLRDEVLGRVAFDVFPYIQQVGEDKNYLAALAGETSITENLPYTNPETGRLRLFNTQYSPLLDEQNQVVGGIVVLRDITERKRALEEAHQAHQRLAFHFENSPLAVIYWDSDFRVSRWSGSAERLFGWKAEEVIGKHVEDWHFVFDEDLGTVEQVTNRQRIGAEVQGVLRNRNYTKEGSVLFCEWYNSVLRDDAGNIISVLSLVLDVTARNLAEEEKAALLVRERDARRQAEEADRLKDEFLATLSHEMRTPLTSILGWAAMIRNRDIEGETLSRAVETIERNARSQARLIEDLLDVSRIITGNLRLDVTTLDLAPIMLAARDALVPAAEAKQIQIHDEFDRGPFLVRGDAGRLRQIVWNLLLNAIKFTPRDGRVLIRLKRVDSLIRLTVQDNGAGISPEFLPFVFDRFRQQEGSVTRRHGGLGLGLAVVRHLVELHGGSVNAESRGVGHGSTFTVDLPLAEERRREPRSGENVGEFERRGGDARQLRLQNLRVLVVEDDEDSRQLMGMILKRQGAEVVLASSSQEALDALEKSAPHIVVSDIGMPDIDGYELMRRIRTYPAEKGGLAPAIALTGYATPKDRERALSAGYQLHLAKPIEPSELINAISTLVGPKS